MTPPVSGTRATTPVSVLLVDDDERYASFVRSVFESGGGLDVELHHVRRLSDVLPQLDLRPAAVILLDINLPDGDGLQWLLRHRARLQAAVIVLTSDPDRGLAEDVGAAAQDFLAKFQLQPDQLVRAVRYSADRERAWQQLVRSRRYYQSLIEQARDLITVVDESGVIRYQSPASVAVLGVPPETFIGRRLAELVRPGSQSVVDGMLRSLFVGGADTVRGELDVLHADGEVRMLDVVASRAPSEEAELRAVVSSRDVTERRHTEDTLRARDEQLRQVMKMEAIGRLAGGIAHDFSNVLLVITGACERLQDRIASGSLTSEGRSEVSTILNNCGRAASLTRQLLAFSRKQTLSPQPLDLGRLVANCARLLQPLIGEHIQLRMSIEPGLQAIEADPVQVEQVLLNLAINARDAMPDGGVLSLRVGGTTVTDAFALDHPPIVPGPYVVLEVQDTGCGMTPETMARAFDPFFTTKGLDGTGLGLSTVYGIVKQSGGYIWIASEPGAGATFTIHMPPTWAPAVPTDPPQPASQRTNQRATILVTEDDPDVREMLALLLQSAGHTVLTAENPDAALAVAAAHEGVIELLLTDVVMPGGTGRDLARRITVVRPDLRVLYISGYPEYGATSGTVLEPGVPFLAKPFTRAALIQKITEVLP